ncbi:MAG: hypothetical protein KQH79_01135 [Bacteroidetes bacterium]|nr:hypothetical protein [Bacteroidota bacterium]
MKKKSKKNRTQIDQELIIQRAISSGGFLFPETVNEVIEYERRFGNTDVILPDDLKEPLFLESKDDCSPISAVDSSSNYSMAARTADESIPEEIKIRMERDRKNYKKKKNKNVG